MQLTFRSLNNPDLLVELIGMLGNLSIPDFDFCKLSEAYKLHDFIANSLNRAATASRQQSARPGTAKGGSEMGSGISDDDDITLEMINLLATMAADDGMAVVIAKTTIIQSLLELMMGTPSDSNLTQKQEKKRMTRLSFRLRFACSIFCSTRSRGTFSYQRRVSQDAINSHRTRDCLLLD